MLLLGEIYNDIYRSVTKSKDWWTLFSINVWLWVWRLFNDLKYFVPKTDKERIDIIYEIQKKDFTKI